MVQFIQYVSTCRLAMWIPLAWSLWIEREMSRGFLKLTVVAYMPFVFFRDISIKVLGYWWWWLFVVPSLRSRRPTGAEKKALDIAFLATPIVSLLAPVATQDTGIIWTGTYFSSFENIWRNQFVFPLPCHLIFSYRLFVVLHK
jgi:hypothetical protein